MYSLLLVCLMPTTYGEQAKPAVAAPQTAAACTGATASCTGAHRSLFHRASCHGSSCTGATASCTGKTAASCTGQAYLYKVKVKMVRVHASCTGSSCAGSSCSGATKAPMPYQAVQPDKAKQSAPLPLPPKKASTELDKDLAIMIPSMQLGRTYRRSVYYEPYVTSK